MYQRLSNYLRRHNLLSEHQSGFRAGHSTLSALVKITDDIRGNIDNKKITILVLLDLTNAFNTVDVDILLGMLRTLNLSPTAHLWFKSYLTNRKQLTKTKDSKSDWCELKAGVPQGGVLSPILFSFFINGIVTSLSSSYHLYADDLQIYASASLDDINSAIDNINNDLSVIGKWTNDYGLNVNALKSQAIVVGSPYYISKLQSVVCPNIVLDGNIIPLAPTVKNLGITIDQTLSWAPQIGEVSRKIIASLHSLKRLQYFLPLGTKALLVRSLLLPILDYADVAYLDPTEDLLNKLERIQNMCIRYVFGLRKFDHITEFRHKLNLLPIRHRRNMHILTLLFQVLFNPSAPNYLSERFEFRVRDDRLRPSKNLILEIPLYNYHSYAKSFTVQAARLWNSLPGDVRMAQSVQSFKLKLFNLWFDAPENLS